MVLYLESFIHINMIEKEQIDLMGENVEFFK